jgi:O-antigen/teichoic acid export membrane protein
MSSGGPNSPLAGDHPSQLGRHFEALAKNVLLKYVSETSRLFQLAFFVIVARRFGAGGLGSLTVLLMVGSVVVLIVGDLGINTTTIARMSSTSGAERVSIASEALFWKNALSLLAFPLACGGMYSTRSSGSWMEILAVGVLSLGVLWLEFLCALTNGIHRLDTEVWVRVAYRGVVYGGGALAALFVSLRADIIYLGAATAVVLGGTFVLLQRRLLPMRVFVRPTNGFDLLGASLPVWVTQLAQLTYLRLDIVILGLLHVAAVETGWYAAAWKIADVLSVIPALLSGAALPLISGGSETGLAAITPRYIKLMYVLPFFFILPLALGADWITRLLYGAGYTGTPRILRVLVWALVPIFIHTFLAVLSVAVRRQAEAAKLAASASILTVIAALVLVPRLGYEAMALISLVANGLFACAMVYTFRVVAGTQWSTGAKAVGSALGVYEICLYVGMDTHPVLLMLGGTCAYGLALLLLRVVRAEHFGHGWRLVSSVVWGRPVGGVSAA